MQNKNRGNIHECQIIKDNHIHSGLKCFNVVRFRLRLGDRKFVKVSTKQEVLWVRDFKCLAGVDTKTGLLASLSHSRNVCGSSGIQAVKVSAKSYCTGSMGILEVKENGTSLDWNGVHQSSPLEN